MKNKMVINRAIACILIFAYKSKGHEHGHYMTQSQKHKHMSDMFSQTYNMSLDRLKYYKQTKDKATTLFLSHKHFSLIKGL